MRLICLEEHVMDQGIAQATSKVQEQNAPYLRESSPQGLPAYASPEEGTDMGAGRLADMDAHGIDMQVLSISNGAQLITGPEAVPVTRTANDRLASAVQAHPTRFAAFAALPMAFPEAAVTELERTNHLGFKGVLLSGRPEAGAVFLDNEKYAPVLAKAAELQVPIYLHPGFPVKEVQEAYYAGLNSLLSARLSLFGWGWHAEVGVHIIRMILSGVFDRHPTLQVIAGHWGEMVPFFLDRLDSVLPQSITHLQRSITETFINHVYVTPSGMFTWPHFQFILDVVGVDRILYSVDYPYLKNNGARNFLESAPLSQVDKEKIAHKNTEKLLNIPALH